MAQEISWYLVGLWMIGKAAGVDKKLIRPTAELLEAGSEFMK